MRWLAIVAIAVAFGAGYWAGRRSAPAGEAEKADLETLMTRTQRLIDLAATAAKSRGHALDAYRGAWMRQDAARRAKAGGSTVLAAQLSIKARQHARKVLEANGAPVPEDLLLDPPAEKALGLPEDDAGRDRLMEEAEERTPPPEELLGDGGEAREPMVEVATRLLARTDECMRRARDAAREGGEETDKYRLAWMRQEAARRCLADERSQLAAKFSLQARKLALKVLAANGAAAEGEWAENLPQEQALKAPVEDIPDAQFDPLLDEVAAETPEVERLLEEEG